ncbi:unnamed protein product [Mytilus coruscus]|uniref:Reverse transcriptase domain-containing protein n=1 Tax=Mytilus coruscus TaxID=42192 RepID=A0A6J8E5U4_MYTCO|nr:unnamed protein product [Mytilus coruscus]
MGFITPPVIGANPADAFHKAFNEPTSEVDKGEGFDENPEDTEWNIPQLNTEEKTGSKIGTNRSKAVNASLSIKSSKDCITEITKRHLRPDNCSLMVVPKVNKEIWENIPNQAHSSDVYLQEVQKSMMAGMVPIVNLANQLAIKKEPIDPSIVKSELSDSISLMGHAYYSLSMKRRYDIRRFLNPRYQRVCSHDIPVNENLFGDNIMSRIKELGDPTKIPIGINTSRSNRRYMSGSLNSRGPAAGSEQQQDKRPTSAKVKRKRTWFPPSNSIKDVNSISKVRKLKKSFWKTITSDRWILDAVEGYKIEFLQKPVQYRKPKAISQNGFRCCYYIDDSLLMNQDYEKCSKEASIMANVIEKLGFTVNTKKSVVIPTQRIVFFGLLIDTVKFRVFLTDEKIDKILYFCNLILHQKRITIRLFSKLIGLIIHAFNTVLQGPLHYRNLERDKIENLKGSNDYDTIITLSEKSKLELNWWLKNVRKLNGKPIKQDNILFWIETDASLKGWGACYEKQTAGGRWTHLESICYINFLELLSVFYALKAFCSNCSQCHIGIKSDNSTAVSYIQFMGGMISEKLDTLAIEIWTWCLDRDIFLTAQHIPGKSNLQADKLSRNFSDNHEWKLSEPTFSRICSQLFTPNVDLFASRHNAQMDKFVSWIYDPEAMTLICNPIRLPRHKDLLYMPHTMECHPPSRKLVLVACAVSGNHCKIQDYQDSKYLLSCPHGGQQQLNSISIDGKSGQFGVMNNIPVLFDRLK